MKFYLTYEEKERIRKLGVLKTSQVAYFLQVSQQTIINWINKKWLKANYLKHYKMYLIKAEELIKFVEEILRDFKEF